MRRVLKADTVITLVVVSENGERLTFTGLVDLPITIADVEDRGKRPHLWAIDARSSTRRRAARRPTRAGMR